MILPDGNFTTDNSNNSTSHKDVLIKIVGASIWTITTLLILLLNSVCLVLLHYVQGFNRSTIIFLKSMTISDLILGLFFYLPMIAVYLSDRIWPLGDAFCLIEAWVVRQGLPLSAFSVLLVTLDRYIAIVHPMQYEIWLSPKRARIIVCSTWFLTNMYALMTLLATYFSYGTLKGVYSEFFLICTIGTNNTYTIIMLILLSMGILVIITIMYIKILMIAKRHTAHIASHRPSVDGVFLPPPSPNRKSFTTVFIITMTLVLGWMPSAIIGLVNNEDPLFLIIIVTQTALASVSWLNVIVYCVRNQAFKEAGQLLLSRILRYCKGCCQNNDN